MKCLFRFCSFVAQSIRLETEQEEKRLLQDQLRQLEISSIETTNKLSEQIDQVEQRISFLLHRRRLQLKEKLDEKQNTCLQLQHDYEKRIQDIM